MVTVTRRRPPATDYRTGDPAAGSATDTDLTAAAIYPTADDGSSSDLAERGRNGAIERLTVAFRNPDVDIEPGDTIIHAGTTYEVDGFPQRFRNPLAPGSDGATVNLWRSIG